MAEKCVKLQDTIRQLLFETTDCLLLLLSIYVSPPELPPPSLLTLTPSSTQLFRGERFTVRSAVAADQSDTCEFTAVSGSSGLYWCEGTEGRSNAVNVTVSYGTVILKTPALPVLEGSKVVLYCQYFTGSHNETTFFKDGVAVVTNSSSSSDGVMKMTIENVTQEAEGFYKCASRDKKKESPESWLSVRPDPGSWKWVIVSCGIVSLFFMPLTVWLVRHYSHTKQEKLLQKIDEMAAHNGGTYYQIDEQMLNTIKEKQLDVAERAGNRRRKSEEQRRQMKALIPEEKKTISELRLILLGSRSVGKTSVGNSILGSKEQEDGKRTAHSAARQGFMGETKITVVDTPGWWKGFSMDDSPEAMREEVKLSPFLCLPGPHLFLLMIDADASFNAKHLRAVTSHVELLGEEVWRRTIVVFTRGDWLGTQSVEEYIEGEGEALQSLVEKCGNRYHVMDNKNKDDGTQITELLEKITETVAGNGWDYFVPDEQIFKAIEEKRSKVEKAAQMRQSQVMDKRKLLRGNSKELPELTVVMLGQKTFGKSATGNNLLRKEVFATCENESCQVVVGEAAGRTVTVIDTPGWLMDPSCCTEERDKEIVRGLSLSPSGVHAVLLVVPLDLRFREAQRDALEEHMNLFDATVWKHTMVLFTYGDNLLDRTVEEHIEREHGALRWLIDKCENKYHVVNNTKRMDMGQVNELFQKIEEMVAGNGDRLFRPEMNDVHARIDEKFGRRQLKMVLKQRLEEEYKKRELELMTGFKETLLQLQASAHRGSLTGTKTKSLIPDVNKIKPKGIGQRRKDGKEKDESMDNKISQEIDKLDKEIEKKSSDLKLSSMEIFHPELKGESPSIDGSLSPREDPTFNKVIGWLSHLQISRNFDNQMTLNFSQTSGYRSMPNDELDFDEEEE
ncbi:uncharacterized protein LOC129094773 [Anoplopoma fimbria]|uniref:uncharacterized protein LOC129094773 n=1 Tax=Anoplopoma fimbria TaxID=229290 RepID=UPI0023EB3A4A|nr:uncharacterized protein LOC129094773 [Anoplopoma fimbria]